MRYLVLTFCLVAVAVAQDESLEDHMLEHFARATQVQSAVVAGDLDGVDVHAEWLAEHPSPDGLPEGWQPYVKRMRELAWEVKNTRSLTVAAGATADMAGVCGDCHRNFEVKTWLDVTTEPPAGTSLSSRMGRHQWAADRLWEGLIGPSDDAWYAGSEALAEAPLTARQVLGEDEVSADYLADRVHTLGREARKTANDQSRVRLYGQLLSTCAECHSLYRNR